MSRAQRTGSPRRAMAAWPPGEDRAMYKPHRRTSVVTCVTVPRVASGAFLPSEASKPMEAAMYVSSRPIRPPQHDPAPSQGGLRPVLAFVLYALLAVAGTLLLARHDGAAFQCGEDPAACGVP